MNKEDEKVKSKESRREQMNLSKEKELRIGNEDEKEADRKEM